MKRRTFLKGIIAASIAPAFIQIDNLMKIVAPRPMIFRVEMADLMSPLDHFSENILTPAMKLLVEQIDKEIMEISGIQNIMRGDIITIEGVYEKG